MFSSLLSRLAISGVVLATSFGGLMVSPASSATVTLRLVSQANSKPAIDLLVEKFRAANPDIEVNVNYGESSQYNSQITAQLAAGTAPDLMITFPGTGALPSLQRLAKAGYLADLADLGFTDQLPETLRPLITDGAKTYAWPIGESDYFMIYNKKLFAELGLTPPATFADLAQLCKKAKDAGLDAIVYGGGGVPTNGVVALSLAAQTVYSKTPDWTSQRNAGSVDFVTSDGWKAALGEFADLISAGCLNKDAAGMTVADQFATLAGGKALMTFGHSQFVGLARAATTSTSPFELGIFPFPAATAEERRVPVAYPQQLVINARSEHVAEAKKFIAFAAQPEIASEVAAASGFVSIGDAAKGSRPEYQSPIAPLLAEGKAMSFPLFTWPDPALFLSLSIQVQGMLTGQTKAEDVLAAIDKAWPKQ